MSFKGYTSAGYIEDHLGRQLTAPELDKVGRLTEVAENFIDNWTGRSWAGGLTITDEQYGIEEKMQTVRDQYVNPNWLVDQGYTGGFGSPRYGIFWYGDIQLKGRPVDKIIAVRSRPSYDIPLAPLAPLGVTTSGTGGFISQGTYQIGYTWIYSSGTETAISPLTNISTVANDNYSTITITLPSLPTGVTGLNLYSSIANGSLMYLCNVTPLTSGPITLYTLPGNGQPQPPLYDLPYSVRNLQDGRIWIPNYYQYYYVWVTYSTLDSVPADIREIATQIVAFWITRNSTGTGGINLTGTGPLKSYTLGADIQMQFATTQYKNQMNIPGIPDTVLPLLLRRKRNVIG